MKETVVRYRTNISRDGLLKGSFRLVFLTDLHNCSWGRRNSRLLSLIDESKPDLVLCGGDMLVAHPSRGRNNLEKAADFMRLLSKKHKVYYAMGNHEYRLMAYPDFYRGMYAEYRRSLKNSDITFLNNDSVKIKTGGVDVRIFGLSIPRKYYRRFKKTELTVSFMRRAIGEAGKDAVNILMAHHPKYIKTYLKWGADITLTGHYHGGVVHTGANKGLVSPDPSVFPHYAHGIVEKNQKTVIIGSGLGEHTIPFRINNPRELVVEDVFVNTQSPDISGKV